MLIQLSWLLNNLLLEMEELEQCESKKGAHFEPRVWSIECRSFGWSLKTITKWTKLTLKVARSLK